MNRRNRAGISLAVVVAMLAAVLVPLVAPATAGATGSPTATIRFADGSSSSSAQVGDEIALDLTIANCTNSTTGNFTGRLAFENWTTFPVGPSWTGGTTYGADWPKITNGTGLQDGVYRLYLTVPPIANGAHTVKMWWLQGVGCYGGGGWSDAISLYVGTPAPTTTTTTSTTTTSTTTSTTTTTIAPVATPSVSMSPNPATTADTLNFDITVSGNQATPTGYAGVGFFATGDNSMFFNTGCSLVAGSCTASISAATVAANAGMSFDVKPFYNGSGTYPYVLGSASSFTLTAPTTTTTPPTTEAPTTTVPPTTTPPTTEPPTTVPPTTEAPTTTIPTTTIPTTTIPTTTIPTTTVPVTPAPRTPSSPSTTVPRQAPRSVSCPERRPYRVYENFESRAIAAYLVARCGYRTEWRRVARTNGAYAVPNEWPRSRQIPARWLF